MNNGHIDIVFDGPPANESGRFIEVEDMAHRSINIGEWLQRPADGYWVLRLPIAAAPTGVPMEIRVDKDVIQRFDTARQVWAVRHKRTGVIGIREDRLDAENSARLNHDLEIVSRWETHWETPTPGRD